MSAGAVVGLLLFLVGILLLVLWGFDMSDRGNLLVPGIICCGGGFVVMWMFGRSSKS